MTGIDYADRPDLAACARKLDAGLRPILDRILAAQGRTYAETLALVDSDSADALPTPIPINPTRKSA